MWLQHQTVPSDLTAQPKLRLLAEYDVILNDDEFALVSSSPKIHIDPSPFITVAASQAEMQPHERPAQTNDWLQVFPVQHDSPTPPHVHVPPMHESEPLHETPPQHDCETSPHAQTPAGVQERFAPQLAPQQGWPAAPHG